MLTAEAGGISPDLRLGTICVSYTPIREYWIPAGRSPFANGSSTWTPLRREGYRRAGPDRKGNLANVRGVSGGVLEYRIDWRPGYRVYFGRDGQTLVIPLAGGAKRCQRDIGAAQERWADYRRRTKEER